ncbi:hypothetical protein NC651_025337 [Populus alba x Populus x berolinensis]|nr:hypothetical protein NC651_025337 [Populus alba x Populus x berolinensis]
MNGVKEIEPPRNSMDNGRSVLQSCGGELSWKRCGGAQATTYRLFFIDFSTTTW